MRRLLVLASAALAGLAVSVIPALAQTSEVNAGGNSNTFSPATVTINAGGTVRWRYAGGPSHNVDLQGVGALNSPSTGWTVERTFTAPGTFRFRCDPHSSSYTSGMVGAVVVQAASSTGTTTSPTTTTTVPTGTTTGPTTPTTPTTTAPSGTTPTTTTPSGGGGTGGVAPRFQGLRVLRSRFCTRRSRTCRRPGVVLVVDLDRAGDLVGELSRRPLRGGGNYRRFGEVRFNGVGTTRRQLKFTKTAAGRRLIAGRYRLRLSGVGTDARRRTVLFRVTS